MKFNQNIPSVEKISLYEISDPQKSQKIQKRSKKEKNTGDHR